MFVLLNFRSCNHVIAANWDAIKNEISYSNVIQRDNLIFARKLDKKLVAVAKEGDKKVEGHAPALLCSHVSIVRPRVSTRSGRREPGGRR